MFSFLRTLCYRYCHHLHATQTLIYEYNDIICFCNIDFFCNSDGHDSVQDAAIALELAFLKAKQGENGSFICPWLDDPVPKCSIFEPLLNCEVSLCIGGLFYARFIHNQLDARVNCLTCHLLTSCTLFQHAEFDRSIFFGICAWHTLGAGLWYTCVGRLRFWIQVCN